MRKMTAVYKSLLIEDQTSYRFNILYERWNKTQSLLVCTEDNKLIFRKAKHKIKYRRSAFYAEELYIGKELSDVLCDLVEAAVNSASYYDYYGGPDDGATFYYISGGRAAIHHEPWSPFPLENPDINNIQRLYDILKVILHSIHTQNVEFLANQKDEMISLTDAFRQELKP